MSTIVQTIGSRPLADFCTIYRCDSCHGVLRPLAFINRPEAVFAEGKFGMNVVVRIEVSDSTFPTVFVSTSSTQHNGFKLPAGELRVVVDGVAYDRVVCRVCLRAALLRCADRRLCRATPDAAVQETDIKFS